MPARSSRHRRQRRRRPGVSGFSGGSSAGSAWMVLRFSTSSLSSSFRSSASSAVIGMNLPSRQVKVGCQRHPDLLEHGDHVDVAELTVTRLVGEAVVALEPRTLVRQIRAVVRACCRAGRTGSSGRRGCRCCGSARRQGSRAECGRIPPRRACAFAPEADSNATVATTPGDVSGKRIEPSIFRTPQSFCSRVPLYNACGAERRAPSTTVSVVTVGVGAPPRVLHSPKR